MPLELIHQALSGRVAGAVAERMPQGVTLGHRRLCPSYPKFSFKLVRYEIERCLAVPSGLEGGILRPFMHFDHPPFAAFRADCVIMRFF
jgi:hypothetical protein